MIGNLLCGCLTKPRLHVSLCKVVPNYSYLDTSIIGSVNPTVPIAVACRHLLSQGPFCGVVPHGSTTVSPMSPSPKVVPWLRVVRQSIRPRSTFSSTSLVFRSPQRTVIRTGASKTSHKHALPINSLQPLYPVVSFIRSTLQYLQ